MKRLTVAVAARNNQDTIAECVSSCLSSGLEVLVGDMGSSDETASVAESLGVRVESLGFHDDHSACRNRLMGMIQSEWVLFINGNESIARGGDKIGDFLSGSSKRVSVIQSHVLTKPTRLLRPSSGLSFKNPVFEYVDASGELCDLYMKSKPTDCHEENSRIVRSWMRSQPLSTQPHYYMSCVRLAMGSYSEFSKEANHFLFMDKSKGASYYMTKYYLSMVCAYHDRDYQQSCRHAMECLADKPTMSEYWCMMGDCYYALNKFDKAYEFYENALIIGSKRLRGDDMPVHLDCYKSHPSNMMESCRKALGSSRAFAPSR